MLITKRWLSQYIDGELDPKHTEKGLTDLGLEVEDILYYSKDLKDIIIGEIVKISNHPEASKLKICICDIKSEKLTIVTGADNIYEGMKCPVVKVGGKIHNSEIKEVNLRGVYSFGMFCSLEELGVSQSLLSDTEKKGIYDIKDFRGDLGDDFISYTGRDDVGIEIGLTPNRSDCNGLYNIAREVAMLYKRPLKELNLLNINEGTSEVNVEIEESSGVGRFCGGIIDNVVIDESPIEMQNLLRNIGIRPINNIVDITNYVMYETGQPLHAYDLDTIKDKKIILRSAFANEKFVTLDNVERELNEQDIIVADGEKPVSLGGVMGGLSSEVTSKTKRIFLEAASFNGAKIRKTSRRLNLRSEASSRFEKGLSKETALLGLKRALYLIQKMQIGLIDEHYIDIYPVKEVTPRIKTSTNRINKILGSDIINSDIKEIFKSLSFKVEEENEYLFITPQFHRIDIKEEIDLIEEVLRIYGINNIPGTLPSTKTNTLAHDPRTLLKEKVQGTLEGSGFNEIISYSFIDENALRNLKLKYNSDDLVKIINPLSEKQGIMRTELLPSIYENYERNFKRQQKIISLFEVGRVFHKTEDSLPREELRVGAIISSFRTKTLKSKTFIDFFLMKGILDNLLNTVGGNKWDLITESEKETYHPGRCGKILYDNKEIGYIGQIHPIINEEHGISEDTYYFEITLDDFLDIKVPKFKPLPKYPSITRDISVTIPRDIPNRDVRNVIRKAADFKVVEFNVFDIYTGDKIDKKLKSIAYSLVFQDEKKTLTDKEVNVYIQEILNSLENELGAKLRA